MRLCTLDTEYVGPGLPLWLPKGAAVAEELEKLAKETELLAGYVRVKTPHIAKEKLYLTSGHLPVLYAESMFPPMVLDELKDQTEKRIERDKLNDKLLKLRTDLNSAAEDLVQSQKQLIQDADLVGEDR